MMKNLEYNIFIILPILSIVLFVSLVSIAMITYDGGNAIDNFSYGYSFSLNYLSDLGRDIGYSGKNNQMSFYTFNLSLIIIGISFLIFLRVVVQEI